MTGAGQVLSSSRSARTPQSSLQSRDLVHGSEGKRSGVRVPAIQFLVCRGTFSLFT